MTYLKQDGTLALILLLVSITPPKRLRWHDKRFYALVLKESAHRDGCFERFGIAQAIFDGGVEVIGRHYSYSISSETSSRKGRCPSPQNVESEVDVEIEAAISKFNANIYFLVRSSHRVNLQDGLNLRLVPSMPLEKIIFEEKKIYSSRPSPDSDKAWDELLPPGRGYVFIKDGQSHGLKEPGEMTKNGEIYSVALFHQIHCLGMLRGNYWELLSRADKQDDLESLKNFAQHHMKNNHANHCFDYLRQSLQCAADMSLEWPEPGTKSTDGWGVPHLCKSWDSVMGYMDKNHLNASSRHDIGGE
ncbi:hypothetical protein DL95DRAFT_399693 [Leptodontidium sp. 2 PMI_412]|nr:hypothetical protein DL95DRAFT_399693 [Leptodontidium sp. 2 PMI_412]